MKRKIPQRKSAQSGKPSESKASTVMIIVAIVGAIWGVGYIFGHEILHYSKLTSILIAPVFCLLLVVVFWLVNNM